MLSLLRVTTRGCRYLLLFLHFASTRSIYLLSSRPTIPHPSSNDITSARVISSIAGSLPSIPSLSTGQSACTYNNNSDNRYFIHLAAHSPHVTMQLLSMMICLLACLLLRLVCAVMGIALSFPSMFFLLFSRQKRCRSLTPKHQCRL